MSSSGKRGATSMKAGIAEFCRKTLYRMTDDRGAQHSASRRH